MLHDIHNMMSENRKSNTSRRRKVLKTVGSVFAASSFGSGAVAAGGTRSEKEDERRRYEALSNMRDKGVGIDQFHRILEKNGFKVVSSTTNAYNVSFQHGSGGQVGTMQYPKDALTVTVSHYLGQYSKYCDIDWTVNTGGFNGGEDPADNFTLGWTENQYLFDGETHSDNSSLRNRDAEGAVWSWRDADYYTDGGVSGYGTAYLDDQGDCNKRHYYGTFEHTWQEVSINSISFGGSVNIVYSDETKRWKKFPSDSHPGTC